MPTATLGDRIRAQRGDLSLRALASRSGVHYTTLCRIEGGQQPHEDTLRRLSVALGVPVAQLVGHPSAGRT